MTDHDALLRTIVEQPDEDMPRLAFADWLDENADAFPDATSVHARADFIRCDIAMSRLREYDPARLRWEWIEKPRREAEPWASSSLPGAPPGCAFARAPLFRRGFPWAVVCEPHGGQIPEPPHELFPLESVRFRHCGPTGLALLSSAPWAARLRAVEFERGTSPPFVGILEFPFDRLPVLTRLAFLDDMLGAPEARWLITAPAFRQVRALSVIRSSGIGTAVAEELIRVGQPGALRELHMVAVNLSLAVLAALLDAPVCDRLDVLALGGDGLRDSLQKFRVLGQIADPPPVRVLDLSDETPSAVAIEWLLASPILPGVCKLDLSRCSLNSQRVQGAVRVRSRTSASSDSTATRSATTVPLQSRRRHNSHDSAYSTSVSARLVMKAFAILESPLADGLVLLDLTGSPVSPAMKEVLRARMGDRVCLMPDHA